MQFEQRNPNDGELHKIYIGMTKQMILLKEIIGKFNKSRIFKDNDCEELKNIFMDMDYWLYMLNLASQDSSKEDEASINRIYGSDETFQENIELMEGIYECDSNLIKTEVNDDDLCGLNKGNDETICDIFNDINEKTIDPLEFESNKYENIDGNIEAEDVVFETFKVECIEQSEEIVSSDIFLSSPPNLNGYSDSKLEPFKCEACGRWFARKEDLCKHSKLHGERPYRCDTCGKAFALKGSLKSHLLIHFGKKQFTCDTCGREFLRYAELKRHTKIAHFNEEQLYNYKCEICKTRFLEKPNYSDHLKTHFLEKKFKCELCTESFLLSIELEEHLKTHPTENTVRCDICGKTLAKVSIREHLKHHSNKHKKSFKCDNCGRVFGRKSVFIKHLQLHTGEKPFKCDVCGKSFAMMYYLTSHMTTHSDERPFKCEICKEAFPRRSYLKIHAKSHYRLQTKLNEATNSEQC